MNEHIVKAVEILRLGGLVAFPTETVYGLGADAANPTAIEKIFIAKQRPIDHPVIVHLADKTQITEWARDVFPRAQQLARAFWPGPLTLIFKKAAHVSPLLTGGQDTIGLRVPNHPLALALLKSYGGGIAAPSANRFGRISPTTAAAVYEELGDAVDYILEGGQCAVGVESTIVDMSGHDPVILRPGMISAAEIEAVLQQPLSQQKKDAPRVSGSLESHYAPSTKTQLLSREQIAYFLQQATPDDLPLGIISFHSASFSHVAEHVIMPDDPARYAHDLYAVLRELDKKKLRHILIEAVPNASEWEAIRDRLQRASKIRHQTS